MKKLALITGSTSGIGLEIAHKLASNGIDLIINGYGDEGEIKANIENLQKSGIQAHYIPADMSRPEDIASMFEQIRKIGTLDILINNAGIQHVSPIKDFPSDKWESILRINLIACFYTIKEALVDMEQKGFGRIINMASAHGLVASPFKSAYVAAKHGLVGLTKSVALEVAEKGITVNSICPGYVNTPLVQGQVKATAIARGITEDEVIRNVMLGPQATKRFIEPSEVAALAYFLCTEDARSITGSHFSIDGGWTAA